MILEYLIDKIQIMEKVKDWKEAIRIGAKPLLENGSIEERYIDAMIEMCQKHNAYIVLADRFAMPHASPQSGVNKMGVSLLVVREPVDFLGKPVQIILTLASIDNRSHLLLLKDVANILSDESRIEEVINAAGVSDISVILAKYLKEEEAFI